MKKKNKEVKKKEVETGGRGKKYNDNGGSRSGGSSSSSSSGSSSGSSGGRGSNRRRGKDVEEGKDRDLEEEESSEDEESDEEMWEYVDLHPDSNLQYLLDDHDAEESAPNSASFDNDNPFISFSSSSSSFSSSTSSLSKSEQVCYELQQMNYRMKASKELKRRLPQLIPEIHGMNVDFINKCMNFFLDMETSDLLFPNAAALDGGTITYWRSFLPMIVSPPSSSSTSLLPSSFPDSISSSSPSHSFSSPSPSLLSVNPLIFPDSTIPPITSDMGSTTSLTAFLSTFPFSTATEKPSLTAAQAMTVLARIALGYCYTVTAEAECERIFSLLKWAMPKRRNRLGKEALFYTLSEHAGEKKNK